MLHLPRDDTTTFGGLLRLEDMDALLCCAACPAAWAELLVFKGLVQVDTYATPHVAFASGASADIYKQAAIEFHPLHPPHPPGTLQPLEVRLVP